MSTYFISDTHFGHANIIKYENRPFTSVDHMTEQLISNWNATVSNKDTVYILGDFIWGDEQFTTKIINSLKGNKFLILGNHDNPKSYTSPKLQWIKHYAEIKLDSKNIVLCHYPLLSWNKQHYGSINIYGHIHSKHPPFSQQNQYNACVEINNYTPVSFDVLVQNNAVWQTKLT